MDQATTETAAIVRRMVSRTLVVVGGSFAATAVAWAISSASASAESTCDTLRIDAVASRIDAVAGLAQVIQPLVGVDPVASKPESALVGVVCGVEQIVPPPSENPIKDLGEQATRAVDDFTHHFGQFPEVPIEIGEIGWSDRPGAKPAPSGGTHEHPSLVPPVGEHSAAAPTLAVEPGLDRDIHALRSAKDRALAEGMTGGTSPRQIRQGRGSPELASNGPDVPSAPGMPAPLPVTPVGIPAPGSAGHQGGGADSSGFTALPWPTGRFDLFGGKALGDRGMRLPDRPGTQPGVTPD